MFIFYDTETTGLNADFDQILQFALVFTDENLNILSSKKIQCRRSPWVVPSPAAMLITGFSPDDLKTAKYSNYEMMKEVVDWIKSQHWPVVFSGYNTLIFDEKILAQNLHQNLLDPGLTLAPNDFNDKTNGRFDIRVAVKAATAYLPGLLKLDQQNDSGYATTSLAAVAEQNGVTLSAEDAHDAMNDVKATIGVARFIKNGAPALWEQLLALSTAKGVNDFIAAHAVFTQCHVANGKSGAIVATEAVDGILFDLSTDPAPYLAMTVEQLTNIMSSKTTLPFRKIIKDSQPLIMPLDQSQAALPLDFDENLAQARAHAIKMDAGFQARLADAAAVVLAAKPRPSLLLPEKLIGNAVDPAVKPKLAAWIASFHAASTVQEAAQVIDKFYHDIGDAAINADPALRRFINFAGRILFEKSPSALTGDKAARMRRFQADHILNTDPEAAYTTLPKAREQLQKIEEERAAGKGKWGLVKDSDIRALKLYYTAIEKENLPHYTPRPVTPPAANDAAAPVVKKPAGPSAP